MSDGISQSFKVEWLNTTLKFIKNDNQMIMAFPEMPTSHVEYLHNLIWQRKNDVGLGFKSLYAPLWEAMRIYSLKYRFKVSVLKSTDDMGHLVIEKIKKADKEEDRSDNKEESVTDVVKVSKPKADKQIKKKKQTKSEKYLIEKSKIIESISPSFLRTSLQKILDFIKDEKEASLLFTDLAPVEAKFLENFLGIYNRRYMFEDMMSPACNNIFNEMWKCFNRFDKTCKLEVDASKTNIKTKKREVSFLKVPRYVRPTMTRAMLRQEKEKNDAENSSTADKSDVDPRSKFLKALSVNKDLSNEINSPPVNIDIRSNIRTVSNTSEIKSQNDNSKNTPATDNQNMPNTINNSLIDKNKTEFNGNNSTKISDKIDKKLTTINNAIIDNINKTKSNLVGDEKYKECSKREIKDDQDKETTSVTYYVLQSEEKCSIDMKNSNKERYKSSSQEKNASSNSAAGNTLSEKNNLSKSCTSSANEIISKEASKFLKDPSQKKLPPKKSITFEKSTELDTTSEIGVQDINSYIEKRAKQRKKESCPRKNKLLEAMSTPLESDKGLRMMQLMGWEGGALGIRREGITEPIIPMLYLAPGAGLGHITEKSLIKQAKVDFRIDILEKILNLLDKDTPDIVINYKNELSKKEKRFLRSALLSFNKRKRISLPNGVENDLGQKILDKMIMESNLYIGMTISTSNREILIKKIYHDDDENKSKPTNKKDINAVSKNSPADNNINSNIIKLPGKKRDFKILILTKILELVKSEDQHIGIDFDSALLSRYCDCVEKTCSSINRRQKIYGKVVKVIAEEVNKVIDSIGDMCLNVEYGTNMMSLILRKNNNEKRFINSATNALTIRNNSEKNNDNATMCTKADVGNDITLAKDIKDNELLVTNENDELDKDKHGVSNNKSHQNFDNKKLNVLEYYDVINQNSLNIESNDNIRDGNNTDKSVANDCDKDSAKINTDNIDNVEVKIDTDTFQSNDANNNRTNLVTLRKLLQIKSDLTSKKISTENNYDKNVELNTLDGVKETKPSKEVRSKEFDINSDKLKENISDDMNSSRESKKSLIKQKVSTFINSNSTCRKSVLIAKSNDMSCTQFLKVIQNLVATNISDNFLPQLKCHGIDNRGVIYSCYNEGTFDWLKEVLSDYKIIDYNDTIDNKFTVQIKINAVFEAKRVLRLLELCNIGLCCDNWNILEENTNDFSVFIVDIDRDSFNYVCDNNFKLSIGVDEALFSIYCYL
ncbi:putative histone-lysine N-methyltransferase 1 isoform X2 [Vanessa cardui]|uniref:putative histone-lysine N-methyltransferase 1 isoform X2 n=1 Tax=Vanessa cardui TaxID=171605 RepID=UPI001F13BA73|nr:putative histone-lysine N-methyltransferase 1 isoform X2 [Vanessa cardui]